jgi:hypothetical protein
LLKKDGFYNSADAAQMAKWNPYDQTKPSGFFDAYWMFGITDGFGIVIGNPPYVQLSKNHGELANRYKDCNYTTFTRTGDMYQLFYEQGMNLLRQNGYLCFITSNKWMRAGYGEKTRKFFTENSQTIRLIDFAGQKVFESATVDVNIILLEKTQSRHETLGCIIKEKCKDNLTDYIRQHGTTIEFTRSDFWVILSPIEQTIKKKIEKIGIPLKDWDISINYGIKTGCNEAFIINKIKRDELIARDSKSAELIRPILRGRDIKRYGYEFADQYIIATFPSRKYNIDDYPAVREYLLEYGKERLEQSGKPGARKKTSHKWFETQDPIAYWDEFSKQKIIWGEISDKPKFALDFDGKYYPEATTFILTGEKTEYLFVVLNSYLSEWFFSNIGTTTGVGTVRWKKFTIEQLLVISPDDNILVKFNNLVHSLMTMLISFTEFESEANILINLLYGLDKKEVKFIENYRLQRK